MERRARLGFDSQKGNFGMRGFAQEDGIQVAAFLREAYVDTFCALTGCPRPRLCSVDSLAVLV